MFKHMFKDPERAKLKRDILFEQKMQFFEQQSKDPQELSKRLPFVQTALKNTITALYRTDMDKDTVKTEGYLELNIKDDKLSSRTITKWLQDKKIETANGFRLYDFYAELSKLPTGVLIIAPFDIQIGADLPYNMKLTRLGRLKSYEEVFYLGEEPEPSVLKMPVIDAPFPVLSRKQILRCFSQISSLSMNDKHICDSIISPYVSCDVERTNVNGIGTSFLSNAKQTSEDITKLNDAINSSRFGIPLSHYGVLNVLEGKAIDIQNMRFSPNFQKLKAISWNLQSNQQANNLVSSDFKYTTDGINLENMRDIKHNVALQQSLVYYSLMKNKSVPYELHGTVMVNAIKTIESWRGKLDKSVLGDIIDEANMETQVARIASYYIGVSKKFDESKLAQKVNTAVEDNVGSIIEKMHTEIPLSERKARHEVDIPLRVRLALYSSDRTLQGFSERLRDLMGYNEKRALEYIDQLEKGGMIFLSDGVHYHWFNESRLKFK